MPQQDDWTGLVDFLGKSLSSLRSRWELEGNGGVGGVKGGGNGIGI